MEEAMETGKVGIAGSMDHATIKEQEGFRCHKCGKFHNTPYGSRGGPMRHWCSKECFEDERN
jgi:hypothetical protein